MKTTNPLLAKLRHHVTGAIERGEGVAIAGIPATNPTAAHTLGNVARGYASPQSDGEGYFAHLSNSDSLVATVYGADKSECNARAATLASAPDLLAALEDCQQRLEEAKHIADKTGKLSDAASFAHSAQEARAAIARAKGL